jgi:1,4-dihydroxy-2-naphthoate octaprenyltransferase
VSRVLAFLKLGRLEFLGGGFLLYGLGAAIAGPPIEVGRYLLGQAAVTAFQLMTHYANDYFDYEADCANTTPTRWSGGSRVLPAGTLPRYVALVAALVLAAIGIAVTVAIAVTGASLAAATLAVVFVLAWSYSAPPLRLCASGLGELDTALVVTVLVPWLGFHLQAEGGSAQLALSIVPLALLQLAMLIAIELPDAAGDVATGKRTLVVRLGVTHASRLYVAITAAAFLWPAVAYGAGVPGRVAIAMAAPAPLAIWQIARSDHTDPAAYERLTWIAVGLFAITAASVLAAYVSLA